MRADTLPHCLARLEVFADGNVKDVLGGASDDGAASGALGLSFVGSKFAASGLVNVAGPSDTIRTNHGAALLVPATGAALNAAALDVRMRLRDWSDRECYGYSYPLVCNVGVRVHADASTRIWATRIDRVPGDSGTDSVDVVRAASEVPSWGVGATVSYTFFAGALTSSDGSTRNAGMVLDVGWTRRALRGDLSAKSATRRTLRREILGTEKVTFDGTEVGLTLFYDQIRSSFTYIWLNGGVDGLSGGQVVAAVELRATLASGLLRRE